MSWQSELPRRVPPSSGAPRCGCCGSPDTVIERTAVTRPRGGPPVVHRFTWCPPCDRRPDPLQGPWGEFIARADGGPGPATG